MDRMAEDKRQRPWRQYSSLLTVISMRPYHRFSTEVGRNVGTLFGTDFLPYEANKRRTMRNGLKHYRRWCRGGGRGG